MQPHSACGIALANYAFNSQLNVGSDASLSLDYTNKQGRSRSAIYRVSGMKVVTDQYGRRKGLEFGIIKSGDSFSCNLKITTSSDYVKDGSMLKMEHSPAHLAGACELIAWGRKGVTGDHRNSRKYGRFSADFISEKQIFVEAKLLKPATHEKSYITFKVKIESI